jgi:Ca2+-binding EF-hand superfamily protein
MTEAVNPLASFFRVVLDELRRRLTPAEFEDLLKECDVDSESTNV